MYCNTLLNLVDLTFFWSLRGLCVKGKCKQHVLQCADKYLSDACMNNSSSGVSAKNSFCVVAFVPEFLTGIAIFQPGQSGRSIVLHQKVVYKYVISV
eukprot:TRINITY_DN16207_c0_g1_i1.p1 TRINITY_DN16207_c0_g1~~TRINITY_DN16207_c0_g1_i1.p1  ORF type:complete len:97 (-),score=0.03 TRINITY_DN16207_c0_g1_i1:159-449(-)